MSRTATKVLAVVIALPIVLLMVLGVFWLLWTAWSWVLPQIYPTGPDALIRPSFGLFVVAWILTTWIGRAVFGRRS